MRLTSLDAVVEAHLHLEWTNGGFLLWARHRHLGGTMADCAAEEYDGLTRNELLDVLCALAAQWGPHGTGSDALE